MMSSENSPSPSKAIDRVSFLPWTWALIVLLVGVHLGTGLWEWWRGYESVFDALIMDRSTRMRVSVGGQLDLNIQQGEWFRFVTSTVLHGDALHLIVNSLAILGLGRILEPLFGGFRCVVCFSLGAVLASIGSHVVGVIQSDGASGGAFTLLAVAAVVGFRFRAQWDREDKRLMGPILWVFILLNLVLSVVLPFVDGVGHLVGFCVGLGLGWLPVGGWRWLDYSVGSLWMSVYCGALVFGAWWVLNGWTALEWIRFWSM